MPRIPKESFQGWALGEERIREGLLKEAADKPVRRYAQFDAMR